MAVNPSYSNKQGIANGPIYGSLLVVFCMVLATLYQPLMGWVWVLSACAIAIAYVRIKRNLPSVKNEKKDFYFGYRASSWGGEIAKKKHDPKKKNSKFVKHISNN